MAFPIIWPQSDIATEISLFLWKRNQMSQMQQYILGCTRKPSRATDMALWQTDLFGV